jgi:hypothetical protein
MLHVTSSLVQVRECTQRLQHSARAVEHLHRQRIKRRGGGGLRGINVQEERECSCSRCGRNRHALSGGIRVRRAIAVKPCVFCSAMRWLSSRGVEHAGSKGPRRSCGGAGFKAAVHN